MNTFLYYLPGKNRSVGVAELSAAGLAYAFELPGHVCREVVAGGPDGGSGCVVAPAGADPTMVGYFADRQTWRRIPGRDAWIGMDPERKPGPADLARRRMLDGHPVELGDGQTWTAPIVRGVSELDGQLRHLCALPVRADIDAEGKWMSGEVLSEYAEVWAVACKHLTDMLLADRENAGKFTVYPDDAVKLLAVNYRIGRMEAAMLGLFSFGGHQIAAVLDAAIDLPAFAALKKKSESDG